MNDDQTQSNSQTPELEPQRDGGGRYIKDVSGNPKGKPAGILNAATRAAFSTMDGSHVEASPSGIGNSVLNP